jgi:hypothetical protein
VAVGREPSGRPVFAWAYSSEVLVPPHWTPISVGGWWVGVTDGDTIEIVVESR